MPYHHGDLRNTLLAAATESIAESGVSKLSLRALAKRVGVSNAAPTHHFGDKTGLLTALAAEGFTLLADAVSSAGDGDGGADMVEMGVSYVRFALEHPAHYAVMFQPGLLDQDDDDLRDAQRRARAALDGGVARAAHESGARGREDAQIAAWSLVHGYATLVLSGTVTATDPIRTAKAVAQHLRFARN